MENYIVINGKKAELTEEQLKQLGIEIKENPFDRTKKNELYYFIDMVDRITKAPEWDDKIDSICYDNANYFNNKDFANQVMLHQQLYRKLLKYAYDNDAEVTKEDWQTDSTKKYAVKYVHFDGTFRIYSAYQIKDLGVVYFKDEDTAINSLEDVIHPFMKKHPEFVW